VTEFAVKDISPDCAFSEPVFLEEPRKLASGKAEERSFLIGVPPLPFTRALRKILLDWDFRTVYSDGVIKEEEPAAKINRTAVSEKLINADMGGDDETPEEQKRRKRAEGVFNSLHVFADSLFAKISLSGFLDYGETAEKMAGYVKLIAADQYFIFRALLEAKGRTGGNILSEHGAKCAVLALIIGIQIKLSAAQMTELGIAALLHEVEMLYIPSRVYLAKHQLTTEEKKLIFTHPVMGYKKLSSFNFPPLVCRAVLEHHELRDGTGYPQRLTGDKISLYAKILALGCACTDVTGKTVQKDMRSTLAGILETQSGKFDETVIKALHYATAQLLAA
jgi:HD-GYP domain-containing protein (c-di-GMP phosphodiesterase class II)